MDAWAIQRGTRVYPLLPRRMPRMKSHEPKTRLRATRTLRGVGGTVLSVLAWLSPLAGCGSESSPAGPTWVHLARYADLQDAASAGWRIEHDGEGVRVSAETFAGEALPVLPGRPVEVAASIPLGSSLRFRPLVLPRPEPGGAWTFRVFCDDVELFSEEVRPTPHGGGAPRAVPLPPPQPDGSALARFRFEVEGPEALTAFATPTIGPTEIGHYGERPWPATYPDIVLFSADTFRGDNLEVLGGPGVTPNLDELARESATFTEAWSPAPWTLPSHVSLLTGLAPYQHATVRGEDALPADAVTLAEVLRSEGYRTVAVTDGIYVSRKHGLAQGFECFHEEKLQPGRTLELADELLAADDGRPLFLFVHSYRAHAPYLVTPEVQRAIADRLPIDLDWVKLSGLLAANPWELQPGDEPPRTLLELIERGHRLYQGGAAEVDRLFGTLRANLEARGVWQGAYVAFSGDHGEAFGEHSTLLHGEGVWQEEVHVPLILRGPDIAPELSDLPVDLTALAPSLALLAGVDAPPAWRGRDLFARTPEDLALTFGCYAGHENWTLAVRRGEQKLVFSGHPGDTEIELVGAFDLSEDPAELGEALPAWAPELFEELEPELLPVLQPILVPDAREELTDEERRQLEALGYHE